MTNKTVAGIILLATLAALMISCGVALCHATEAQERPNGLGVVIDHSNPNVSLVGSIVAGHMVSDADGREGTAIRIHPRGMYSLFDETVTFCGDESARMMTPGGNLLQGWLVFTYKRASPRLISGIPCFELRSVDKIQELTWKP